MPSYTSLVSAAYAQVLETDYTPGATYWAGRIASGLTVKQLMSVQVHDPGYRRRFITGRDSRTVLVYLYRHLLAREPDDNAWGWTGVGETQGWDAVMDALLNSAEYAVRFGDHVVPGSPIVAWDCLRANFTAIASQETFRDETQGSANVAFTTPAYISLDQSRSLTFMFSTGTARPTGLVEVNIVDNSATPPDRASIRLKYNGAWITSETFFRSGTGATRVSGFFDASSYVSGAYPVTAVVRTYRPDGTMTEQSVPVRMPIVNEISSPFGVGWTLAGYQQLRDQSDGVFITDSGKGMWFALLGSDADGSRRYASPPGDFSGVRWSATLQAFMRTYPDGSTVRFSSAGRMTDVADRFGNTTHWSYDSAGRVIAVSDPVGKQTAISYNTAGVVDAVQDPGGRRSTAVSSGPLVWKWNQPDGSMGVDLYEVQDTRGLWALDTYWAPGGDRTLGLQTGTHFDYDAFGRVSVALAPQINTTDHGLSRPTVRSRSLEMALLPPPGTGTISNPAPRVRPEDVRIEATDPRGLTTRVAVDPFGVPTRVEDALGRVTRITRDRNAHAVGTVDPSGHEIRAEYDGPDLKLAEDLTTGDTVHIEYGPYHQPTYVSAPGQRQWRAYNQNGTLLSSRTAPDSARQTSFVFTAEGRPSSVTDPGGHTVTYTYTGPPSDTTNTFRNVLSTLSGANGSRVTSYKYDAYGRVRSATDPTGDQTRIGYDLLNRVRADTNAINGATTYAHGAVGIDSLTDAKGQVYRFSYNALGWKTAEHDPLGASTLYQYDSDGNAVASTDRNNTLVTVAYDALNRPVSRTSGGETTYWRYDTNERWVVVANAASTDSVSFDAAGRPLSTTVVRSGRTYIIANTYTGGRRTQVTATGPGTGSRTIRYHYDAQSQLDSLTDIGGGVTAMTYDEDGLPVGTFLPSGLGVNQSYTTEHLLSLSQYTNGITSLGGGYALDKNGRVNRWRNPRGDSLRDFTYDHVGRLTSFTDSELEASNYVCPGNKTLTSTDPDTGVCTPLGSLGELYSQSFTYDGVGNRTDMAGRVSTGNRLEAFNGYSFTYDLEGNLTRKTNSATGFDQYFSWNGLGQLTGVGRSNGWITYDYDGNGRRVRRVDQASGAVTQYLYDGDDLLMELDANGNPIAEYTYYPGVDDAHSMRRGGNTYYYSTDNVGSVVGLTGPGRQVVNLYRRDPWGNVSYQMEGVPNSLGFMGREYDPDAHLYNFRARWYDPETGRFISQDPIGLSGGINPYAFAGNDPVNFIDPSGTCELMAKVKFHYFDDGTTTVELLNYFWDGDDCGGGAGGIKIKPEGICRQGTNAGEIVIDKSVAASAAAFVNAAAAAVGSPFRITESFRSTARQSQLWAQRFTNPYPVSTPGTSLHETGFALDLNWKGLSATQRSTLLDVAASHGWDQALGRADPVHFQPLGIDLRSGDPARRAAIRFNQAILNRVGSKAHLPNCAAG